MSIVPGGEVTGGEGCGEVGEGVFLSGVFSKQIGPIIWRLTGGGLSASTVSRIVRELDGMVQGYKSRQLGDEYV